MGLKLKFNFVLLTVFLLGFSVSGFLSHRFLHQNAREEIVRNAELMMETAQAVRSYTVSDIRPQLQKVASEEFIPQTVPAFAATETFNRLRQKYREYNYREATLNPTNPRNQAVGWEEGVVQRFRNNASLPEVQGELIDGAERLLYVARPIQIKQEACLSCHSTPQAAPASMLKTYGGNGGFGWQMTETVGAQIVTVPMSLPVKNANRAFNSFMLSLAGIFVFVFLVLNVMLSRLIIRPIAVISAQADAISKGDIDMPEFVLASQDEVGSLAASFNRMRRSLEQAMRLARRQ